MSARSRDSRSPTVSEKLDVQALAVSPPALHAGLHDPPRAFATRRLDSLRHEHHVLRARLRQVREELAHLRHKEHDKAFYRLCQHMEPDYLRHELDLRLLLFARQPDQA